MQRYCHYLVVFKILCHSPKLCKKIRNDTMQNFDFNEALKGIQAGKPITGSDGVLAPLIKHLKLECMVLTVGVNISSVAITD